MNVSADPSSFIILPPTAVHRRRTRRGAFALVITLLILSLLIIVAVSYLSSMVSERQTADAYTSKARAEQVAQAGVDSATAILTESFRDFPDSATVWDVTQSPNAGAAATYNEGTSLYFHAVPDTNGLANPQIASASGTPPPANAPGGNNPGNPACKTFVLPLISGVPKGQAQLVSNKAAVLPTPMNVSEPDPTKQNFTDLNVRRASGDTQGYIGSPPTWTGSAPKPARAYWVNLKGTDNRITGRYAFWIDDESFRANSSFFGDTTQPGHGVQPPDNQSQPTAGSPAKPRSLLPNDLTLLGPLTRAGDSSAGTDATTIFNTRQLYPGSFFPDPLAFRHEAADGSSSFTSSKTDLLSYLLTNQSGTLNLTRHGTQRVNLNGVVPTPAASADPTVPASTKVLQAQVDEIVQTLKFHLPYFGERFYRLTTDIKSSTLNDATQVPGSPKTSVTATGNSDSSEIYYYKVAANLIDYLDTDSQPTIIGTGGLVVAPGSPAGPMNSGGSSNEIWAQGKESAPYMQEAAIRIRAKVTPYAARYSADNVPHTFDLNIDYYVEFWNMSDRDIYASPPSPGSTLPNLHGATLHITNQPTWEMTVYQGAYGNFFCDSPANPLALTYPPYMDYEIDLTNGVLLNGSGGQSAGPGGVVFKAGSVTVVTTDPDCASWVFASPTGQTSPTTTAWSSAANRYATNPQTTYYCPNLKQGTRHYHGTNAIAAGHRGIEQKFRALNFTYDYETEVTLGNQYGYLDSMPFAVAERYYGTTWYSDTSLGYIDYSYCSGLMGNFTDNNLSDQKLAILPRISQLGDPRTNNEQLTLTSAYDTANLGDSTHYFYGLGADATLGYTNPSQKPSAGPPGTNGPFPWPDYYTLPTGQYSTTGATTPPMNAANAPMVVADGPMTSIGQLGDVFDPARLPGAPGKIAYSRGGGRTFKIGQRDDRYCGDPSGNANNNSADAVPASNGWAAWRLADVFSTDDPIELPARININGVLRDNGAALSAALYGFTFQPATNSTDPVIHGDNHAASSLAGSSLDTTSTTNGYSQLVSQIKARLTNPSPVNTGNSNGFYVPSGPFFERGELGEIGTFDNALFGMSDPTSTSMTAHAASSSNKTPLVSGVDTYQTYDHSREELCRRISELICTRGDTFTVYAVGQSIVQPTTSAPLKVTGTHRMRVTFRLVPKAIDPANAAGYIDFHPSYNVVNGQYQFLPYDVTTRFAKPHHYDAQVLSATTF